MRTYDERLLVVAAFALRRQKGIPLPTQCEVTQIPRDECRAYLDGLNGNELQALRREASRCSLT
jgi:hypothetical protein